MLFSVVCHRHGSEDRHWPDLGHGTESKRTWVQGFCLLAKWLMDLGMEDTVVKDASCSSFSSLLFSPLVLQSMKRWRKYVFHRGGREQLRLWFSPSFLHFRPPSSLNLSFFTCKIVLLSWFQKPTQNTKMRGCFSPLSKVV